MNNGIIALEEHYRSAAAERKCSELLKKHGLLSTEMSGISETEHQRKLREAMEDVDGIRFAHMDRHGIAIQVLSCVSQISEELPKKEYLSLYRMMNEEVAGIVSAYPERFLGFAALPLKYPKEAAEELEYAVKMLGLKGALAEKPKKTFYDEEANDPILAKLNELEVPFYLHPSVIRKDIADYYFKSESWSAQTSFLFSTGGWGWHMETGIEIVRLILSGAFERYPKLNIIIGHWGEFVPIFLSRLDYMLSKEKTGLKKNISEYYKEHIYISPSGIYSNNELKYCMDIMGADHILFSADYPFIEYGNAGEYLANASICDAEKKKIGYLNANQILKL